MHIRPDLFLDARKPIDKHRVHLPHWQQSGVLQFVTWNLGDALPLAAVKRIRLQRDRWLNSHPKPWDPSTEREYEERFLERWNRWLDCGRGICLLKRPACRQLVVEALFHFNGIRYDLDSFVVMPNHVHALFSPREGHRLGRILHPWKSFTSHEFSKQGYTNGDCWMKDYWDRMIRDMEHYRNVRAYIRNNPRVAKLKPGEFSLWMGED